MTVLASLAKANTATDNGVAALVDGPLRIEPGAIEAAIRRAHDVRAQAFRDTIGALWRFGTRPAVDAGHGGSCPAA